ncbi:Hypothetical protein R9X50_00199700 [Acrodontium crateriforme]|uniref:AAA+ ATPase domain-containing protein n=1 Tax=Acrodontium crateriforme TaxID=150365 RepID=A0AAQ3LZZ8_9PEZI|nr:Hypothetical protein R9X50_00199700 [Acrodontium crateriforme]
MAQPPVIDLSSSAPSTQQKAPPSSHRLATVSASDALRELQAEASCNPKCGLKSLDVLLSADGDASEGGFESGKVTEIWGPSGAGKTALMLETAIIALKNDNAVVWIDGSTPLNPTRLETAINRQCPLLSSEDREKLHLRFHHFSAPTLSHLLAMIIHTGSEFPPDKTSLLIVDGVNMLVDLEYPRFPFRSSTKSEAQKWQAGRRYTVLGNLVAGLNKLAYLNKFAVILSTGCSTRMRYDSGLGAALVPGVGGAEWEAGIRSRMVIFRDFSGRLIGVTKCQGKSFISREEVGEIGRVIGFDLAEDGSLEEKKKTTEPEAQKLLQKVHRSPIKPRKRTYDEIADSDGEDVDEYGWVEADDEHLAAKEMGSEPDETNEEATIQ